MLRASPYLRQVLYRELRAGYHRTLFKADRAGIDYLASRNLADPAMLESFRIGYCNGTLKNALPQSGEVIDQLKALGLLNEKGNEVFYGRVTVPIRHILFTDQPEEVISSIIAYLHSLKPVPSPYLVNGQLSVAARRGEKIFKKARCTDCHVSDFGIGTHQVGSRDLEIQHRLTLGLVLGGYNLSRRLLIRSVQARAFP